MRTDRIVITENVEKFLGAVRALWHASAGEEGMGFLYGNPGEGKSTTLAYAFNHEAREHGGAVLLRARADWTMTTMLQGLMRELGLKPGHRRSQMVDAIIQKLVEREQAIFIDEVDYLFYRSTGHHGLNCLDCLRDIYDLTRVPIVLIGEEDSAKEIDTNPRFSRFKRRITQRVQFKGLSLEDTRRVAAELCEVAVEADLLKRVHEATKGNIGHMVIALGKVEAFARTNGLESVSLADFGNRALR